MENAEIYQFILHFRFVFYIEFFSNSFGMHISRAIHIFLASFVPDILDKRRKKTIRSLLWSRLDLFDLHDFFQRTYFRNDFRNIDF